MRGRQIVFGAAVAFLTWLFLGIIAAFLNVPNFAAKLPDQECRCLITPYLGELDIYISVNGILLGVWILTPAVILGLTSLAIWLRTPPWILDRRRYLKDLKKSAVIGEAVALLIIAALVGEQLYAVGTLSQPSPTETPTTPSEGYMAPNFSIMLLNESTVNLRDFKGNPILLTFIATRCKYCQEEMSQLVDLHKTFGSKIVFLTVSTPRSGDTLEKIQSFASKLGITWLIGLDNGGGATAYEIESVPRTFIIDADQRVRFFHRGTTAPGQLASEIEIVLKSG